MKNTGDLKVIVSNQKTKKAEQNITVEIFDNGELEIVEKTNTLGVAEFRGLKATTRDKGKSIILKYGDKILSDGGHGFDVIADQETEKEFFIDLP